MSVTDNPPKPGTARAFHSPKAWLFLLVMLGAGLTADLTSKSWSFRNVADVPVVLEQSRLLEDPFYNPIPRHESKSILPWNLLHLQLVINRGAVFGLGSDKRIFFIVFTIVAILAGLFVFGRFTQHRHRLAHIALGLILAGGLGNLYDRIMYGVVRDFLHMLPEWNLPFSWRWPGGAPSVFPWVFNVADVLLLIGIGLLMIHINRVEKDRHVKEAGETETDLAESPTLDTGTAATVESDSQSDTT